ncbi:hypothetical protein [Noviherbaspirillum galbum]|uniref:Helix-turn-helix domain-containing protein n=1 Tax=Noviherbaspirillum galbum TaxID=2709383 RepID=A0A6B3SLQ1_9BURK|nr:hypothetical protein [Noviherbaspirillum galbum]NEX61731.1 hypothetical protein [Noviherbaspirillum galbum]
MSIQSNFEHDKRIHSKPAFTVAEFCYEHGNISRSFFHKLVNEGKGPRLMKVGRRTLISTEAAADWRAQMEAQTNQTTVEG